LCPQFSIPRLDFPLNKKPNKFKATPAGSFLRCGEERYEKIGTNNTSPTKKIVV